MHSDTEIFLNRVMSPEETPAWWDDITREDRQGLSSGRFLSEEINNDLSSFAEYTTYNDQRRLFLFSDSQRVAIDGRYRGVGIELKCKGLAFKDLIDGAIHRGVIWRLGNPQNISDLNRASLSIYLLRKGAKPLNAEMSSMFLPIMQELYSQHIYILFINQSGEHWLAGSQTTAPHWLCHTTKVPSWQQHSCESVAQLKSLNAHPVEQKKLYSRSNKHQYLEYVLPNNEKVAIMDWDNHFQVIEIGLMIRAKGYSAVKVRYAKTRNTKTKNIYPCGHGVEQRLKKEMEDKFGIILDWSELN
jgi:hypothetical protein